MCSLAAVIFGVCCFNSQGANKLCACVREIERYVCDINLGLSLRLVCLCIFCFILFGCFGCYCCCYFCFSDPSKLWCKPTHKQRQLNIRVVAAQPSSSTLAIVTTNTTNTTNTTAASTSSTKSTTPGSSTSSGPTYTMEYEFYLLTNPPLSTASAQEIKTAADVAVFALKLEGVVQPVVSKFSQW